MLWTTVAYTMTPVATTVAYVTTILLHLRTTDPLVMLSGSGGAEIAGENYTLTCTVTGGTMTPTYQWWKDGALLTNQTASTIAFRPLQQTSSGVYICEGFIAVNSTNVTLTVRGESIVTE